MNRLHYIDNLRILLSMLVVAHHVSIGYGAMGSWVYVGADTMSGVPRVLVSTLFGIEASFSLSLFFFISAYLTPASLEKKGPAKFMKGQLLRLGTPLLSVVLILDPLLHYGIALHRQTVKEGFLAFWWNDVVLGGFSASHMWFVLALLIFETCYVLYRCCGCFCFSRLIPGEIPSHRHIGAFILVCGVGAFLLRQVYPIGKSFFGMQPGNFVPYFAMYCLGIVVRRKGWLEGLSERVARTWSIAAFLFAPLLAIAMNLVIATPSRLPPFLGGLHWEAFLISFWQALICVGLCGFFTTLFLRKGNFSNGLLRRMGAARYTVYIIHPFFVVGVTVMLEQVPIDRLAKFVLACGLSTGLCFLGAFYARQLPVVRNVL